MRRRAGSKLPRMPWYSDISSWFTSAQALKAAQPRPHRTAYDLDRHAQLGELKVGGSFFLQRDVALFQRRKLIDNRGVTRHVNGCKLRAQGVESAGGVVVSLRLCKRG